MSAKPRILIDVDGVINAFGSSAEGERTILGAFEICVPAGTAARLARMIEPFEPIWATTWEQHAPDYISPLIDGVGADWEFITFTVNGGDPRVKATWKLEGILAWAERPENERVPLVWVDDDLHPDAFEWAAARTVAGVPTALVRTDGLVGLSDDDVTRALEFAGSLVG